MVDLTTQHAGLTLRNPIISGASALGNHIDKLVRLERAGVGAVTTKLISSAVQPPEHDWPYRMAHAGAGWMVSGDPNLPQDYGVRLVKAAKKALKIPVIANFVGIEADVDAWIQNAVALEKAGADALEMDLYCPMQGRGTHAEEHPDEGHGYASICSVPKELGKVMRALKDAIKIPVIPKMNPTVRSITEVASALLDNGASTITMSNCMEGNPGVDIYDGGKSLIKFRTTGNGLPYQGAYLFPMHNRNLALLKDVYGDKIEVCSGGGIYTWEQAVQRFMLGAQSIQLVSVIIQNGVGVIKKTLDGLHNYLAQYGHKSLADIRGISVKTASGGRIGDGLAPAVARVKDAAKCLSCADKCVDKVSADCLALSMGAHGVPKIDTNKCTGCAWCIYHCGSEAIDLVRTEKHVDIFNIKSELTSAI